MSLRTLLAESVSSLRYYRRRTVVTICSLAWGVACFVLLMAYGTGYGNAMESAFRAVGQDIIVMVNGQTSQQAGGERSGRNIRMELSDVSAIRESVPGVGYLSPEIFAGGATVTRGSRERHYTVRGTNAEYRFIRNMTVASGRWIHDEDLLKRNRVAVLGATVAHELFSGIPPDGEEITIGGTRFTVVGVLEAKGQLAQYSDNDNKCVFLPYDTMGLFRIFTTPT